MLARRSAWVVPLTPKIWLEWLSLRRERNFGSSSHPLSEGLDFESPQGYHWLATTVYCDVFKGGRETTWWCGQHDRLPQRLRLAVGLFPDGCRCRLQQAVVARSINISLQTSLMILAGVAMVGIVLAVHNVQRVWDLADYSFRVVGGVVSVAAELLGIPCFRGPLGES